MRLIGVLMVFAGCHPEGMVVPDGRPVPDAPPHGLGISVTWRADPAVPGPMTDAVTVTDVVFQLDFLELLSDFGADGRTTHSRFQLHWADGVVPAPDVFPDAPVARYQQISISLRSGPAQPAYQIQGMWQDQDAGKTRPFRIVDATPLDIPISCDANLPAGGSTSVAIRLDLKDVLESIDFKTVPEQGGVLVVDGQQLMAVHSRVPQAFKLDD